MSTDRLRVEDQLAQVAADLADLDVQVADGEIDQGTAARLRATYVAEAETLRDRLFEASSGDGETAGGRSRRRVIAGSAVLAVGIAVVIVVAVVSLQDDPPGGDATGGVVTDALTGEGVDLSSISNEQMEEVVAANPEVLGMRLALARRYFDDADFNSALPHYMYILERQQHPEALANVGWMTHLSDRPDVALPYVERALELEPDFPQALWFLGNILMALDRPDAAVVQLRSVLAYDDLPEDVRAAAEALLEVAEAAG